MTTEEYDFNPFESPQSLSVPTVSSLKSKVKWAKPFASGRVRAVVVMALLAVVAITDLLGCWWCFLHAALIRATDVQLFRVVTIGNALAVLATGVAFLFWTHRIYRNLPALGTIRPETTPLMAAGWYLVPVAWFAMPYVVMAEIWGNSDPAQIDKLRKTAAPLVKVWWGLFLAHIAFSYLGAFQTPGRFAVDQADLRSIAYAVDCAAAIVAIALAYRVNANQQAKHELIALREQAE